jgi:hypothetical protein
MLFLSNSPLRFPLSILALLVAFITVAVSLQGRSFTTIQGASFKAELVRVNAGYVELKASNGATKWFDIKILSEADQRFIREHGSNLVSMQKMPMSEVVFNANQIDRFIQAEFRQRRIQQNPPVTDEQFIRRVYLDIIGRIPSYGEVISFLNSRDTGKRRKIIDELLKHPGYVSHNYNYWADILRLKSNQRVGGVNAEGGAYIEWVKQALRENRPYDLFVQQLLTASGYPWDNPAVGYYIRDSGTPLDNMSNTIQVFLGTQLVCAQCHNHPFEDWTQKEYYQMAAYTYGVETRLRPDNLEKARKIVKQASKGDRERERSMSRAIRDLFEVITVGAHETKKPLKLPHDYKYEDAKPKSTIAPGPLFRQEVEFGKDETPRETYVRWMTNPKNDLFVKVIANRIWKKVMGHGIFEPVDDLKKDSLVSHPQLMAYLMKLMRDLDFDLKQFERILYNTPTYHRQVSTVDHVKGEPYYFAGPLLRRMTAEQLWDSMLSMTIQDSDQRILRDREEIRIVKKKQQADYMLALKPAQIVDLASQIADIESEFADKRKDLRAQLAKASAAEDDKQIDRLEKERRQLDGQARRKVRAAQSSVQKGMMEDVAMSMSMEERDLANSKTEVELDPRWKGFPKNLVRAAELPSPAPNGHFLRMFGQSDRDTIQNASLQPTVPQALALLNGPMFKELVKTNSVLMKHLLTKETAPEKLDVIFLTLLSRRPSIAEKNLMLQEINRYDEDTQGLSTGYKNVIVALMNTRQYAFVR